MTAEQLGIDKGLQIEPSTSTNGALAHALVESGTNGETNQIAVDPLVSGFLEQTQAKKELFHPMSLQEYLSEVLGGRMQYFRNAYDILNYAITSVGDETLPNKYKDYHFFSKRTDGNAVLAVHRAKEQFMNILGAGKATGGSDFMLGFVGAMGAGKSIFVDSLKAGLEEATELNPVYAVKGCEMQCDPMTVFKFLASPTHLRQAKERGIEIDGHLCPDCKDRIRDSHYNIASFEVEPMVLHTGKGIIKLEPKDTDPKNDPGHLIQLIKKANRGILEIPELYKHDPAFLKRINDLVSGRKIIDEKGREVRLDCLIVTHTTVEEWEKIKNDANLKSLQDRIRLVMIPYVLTATDEARIYEKFLRESKVPFYQRQGDNKWGKHVSERTTHVLAQVATLSRLVDYQKKQADGKVVGTMAASLKLDTYEGKPVKGWEDEDIRVIQEEGERNKEGFTGLSPRTMKAVVTEVLPLPHQCIDPHLALRFMKESLPKAAGLSYSDREKLEKHIEFVRQRYEEDLAKTIRKAFRPDYEDACQRFLDDFLDSNEYYLSNQKEPTPEEVAKGTKPDLSILEKVDAKADQTAITKKQRREELQIKLTSVAERLGISKREKNGMVSSHPDTQKKDVPKITLQDIDIEWLTNGIEGIVFERSGKPEDTLSKLQLTEQQAQHISNPELRARFNPDVMKRLDGVSETLVKHYGFCEHCAWTSIAFVARNQQLLQPKK